MTVNVLFQINPNTSAKITEMVWDHPFKTSEFFRVGGVKNLPNLPTDNSKKMPTEGGRGQKS